MKLSFISFFNMAKTKKILLLGLQGYYNKKLSQKITALQPIHFHNRVLISFDWLAG